MSAFLGEIVLVAKPSGYEVAAQSHMDIQEVFLWLCALLALVTLLRSIRWLLPTKNWDASEQLALKYRHRKSATADHAT